MSAEASQYLSMVYIVAVTDSPCSRPFPFSPTGVWSIGRKFSDKDRTTVGNTLIDQGLSHSLPYHITPSEACCPGTSDVAPELFAWADKKHKVRGEGQNFMVQVWGAVGQLDFSVDLGLQPTCDLHMTPKYLAVRRLHKNFPTSCRTSFRSLYPFCPFRFLISAYCAALHKSWTFFP